MMAAIIAVATWALTDPVEPDGRLGDELATQATTAEAQETPAADSKKARYLASKATEPARRRKRRPARRAAKVVWARNLHTLEVMPLELPRGNVAHERFLRCWFTDEPAAGMPPELVAKVVDTAKLFDTRRVHIVSGYRAPKYNLMLRKKGREVALTSQHTEAMAVDFALPDADVRKIYRHLRTTHIGGVGFYPVTGFVHIDLGRRRTWRGS